MEGHIEYLPENPVPGKPLGRSIVQHDPQSRQYAIRPFLGASPRTGSKVWWRRGVFNQQGSSCTYQTAAGVLHSAPFRTMAPRAALAAVDTEAERHAGYLLAQTLDPWEGGEPTYYGSSTLAGFAALKQIVAEYGFNIEYRWCFGLDDVLDTLGQRSPVGIGITWHSSYDTPGYNGRIKRKRGDSVRGGHAVELLGVNWNDRTVRGVNSWDVTWGDNGRFEMSFTTLGDALEDNGEAATLVRVAA